MSLVFDTSLYMNGGAGGGVSLDKIIVKSATIPTAAVKYVGAVYQYVGETNSTYTHGYIYECKQQETNTITFTPATMSVSGTDFMAFLASISTDEDYESVVKGTFTYDLAGDLWRFVGKDAEDNTILTYQQYTQDFEDAGFTMPVDPQDGDVVEFVRTVSATYAWERIDVQPGATRGRFLALWNCATGLAESNPPSSPYPYGAGDYYIVGTVGTTNYKPSGSSYVIGTASTTVETGDVAVNDTYYYDGTNWNLQKNTATTYTAGTGISISNGTISVASPTLTNTATGTNALTVLGTSSFYTQSLNIGETSEVYGARGVAVGSGSIAGYESVSIGSVSNAQGDYSTAIGKSATASVQNTIAIGTSAQATAQGAIQIGGRTNYEAYTLYCGQYGYTNWKLLDLTNGKIPNERLSFTPGLADSIVNANTGGTSPLKIWQGTLQEWTDGEVVKTWYNWGIPTLVDDYTTTGNVTVSNTGLATIQNDSDDSHYSNVLYKQSTTSVSGDNNFEVLLHFIFNTFNAGYETIFSACQPYDSTMENNFPSWPSLGLRTTASRLQWLMMNAGGSTRYFNAISNNRFTEAMNDHNGNVYVKILNDRGLYRFYSSFDGVDWVEEANAGAFDVSEPLSYTQPLFYGFGSMNNTTYSVQLNDCYVKFNGNTLWEPRVTTYSSGVFTESTEPMTGDTVYSAPHVASALTITAVDAGSITLSDNNTYDYNEDNNEFDYDTIGNIHSDWLCNINGVGVKIGNTLIADYTTLDSVPTQGSTNGITSGAVYTVLGDLETALHNINSGS